MVIMYEGEPVSVPKEVAEFLEQDRKREQAEAKRDKRHLSKGNLETVLKAIACTRWMTLQSGTSGLKICEKLWRVWIRPSRN